MKRSYKKLHFGVRALLILSIVALAGSSLISVRPANAAFTKISDTVTRMKASTAADHTIEMDGHAGLAAAETITVDVSNFDYTTIGAFNILDVDLAVGTTNDCDTSIFSDQTLAATPAGATWGVSHSAGVITFTSGTSTIASGLCVQVEIGSNATSGGAGSTWLTNPASTGSKLVTVGGTWGESGTAAVNIASTDQVTVTATVSETIACSLSGTNAYFGTLSLSNSKYATSTTGGSLVNSAVAYSLNNSTNATNGIRVTVNGATLTSGANTITALGGTATAPAAGTEQFGLRVDGGSLTPQAPYNSATDYAFTASSTELVAKSTAPTATNTLDFHMLANIAPDTEAGTYSTTLTNICTGYF